MKLRLGVAAAIGALIGASGAPQAQANEYTRAEQDCIAKMSGGATNRVPLAKISCARATTPYRCRPLVPTFDKWLEEHPAIKQEIAAEGAETNWMYWMRWTKEIYPEAQEPLRQCINQCAAAPSWDRKLGDCRIDPY